MVQRLSLMGRLSPEEHIICVRSLEAISGMQPRNIEISREVWEPKYKYNPAPGQSQQTEQYRLFLTKSPENVTIEAYEIPEAGRNMKVVSQSVYSTTVLSDHQEIPNFMHELGFEFKSVHKVVGLEFVLQGRVVVRLFKILDSQGQPLDVSGQEIVSASIDVESVTDLNAVDRATQALLNIQQELRGVVALRAPSRAAFNTRVPRVTV